MLAKAKQNPTENERYLEAATQAAKSFREYFACYKALMEAGRKEDAIRFLKKATKAAPFATSYISLAKCYRELGMMDHWRRMLEKCEYDTYGPEQDAQCAYEYYCGGDINKAKEMMVWAEECIDDYLDIYWCAKGYWMIGDKSRAQALLDEYIQDADEYFVKYDCLMEYAVLTESSPEIVEEYYQKALAAAEDSPEELIRIAITSWENGRDRAECTEIANRASELAESISDLRECEDFFLEFAHDPAKIRELLLREEKLDPNCNLVFPQALAYLKIGDTANAVRRIMEEKKNSKLAEFLSNNLDLDIWKEVQAQEFEEYYNRLHADSSLPSVKQNSKKQRKQKRKQQKSARKKNRKK